VRISIGPARIKGQWQSDAGPLPALRRSVTQSLAVKREENYALALVEKADIIPEMAALAKTNKYIRDPAVRSRLIAEGARQSFALEGARGLPAYRESARKSSAKISTKKSAKSS
jgi:hypothetical protein